MYNTLQEFHENLIRRGLFRKRSVSLEDGVQGLASDDFMLPRSLPTSPTSPTAVSGTVEYDPCSFYYLCNKRNFIVEFRASFTAMFFLNEGYFGMAESQDIFRVLQRKEIGVVTLLLDCLIKRREKRTREEESRLFFFFFLNIS